VTADDVLDVIYSASSLLDEERFDDWLELCDEGFSYRINTYSDELRRPMIWLHKQRDELVHLFANINRHERHTGRLRRHVSMVRVEKSEREPLPVRSEVAVYHTELNGVTQLFAIGSYHDSLVRRDGALKLAKREVKLHTRRLPFGPHVVI
jgi:methanesulfonate monooxygenase small subunit